MSAFQDCEFFLATISIIYCYKFQYCINYWDFDAEVYSLTNVLWIIFNRKRWLDIFNLVSHDFIIVWLFAFGMIDAIKNKTFYLKVYFSKINFLYRHTFFYTSKEVFLMYFSSYEYFICPFTRFSIYIILILFAIYFLKQHLFSFKFESRGKCISTYCQQNINPDFYGMTRHIDRVIKNLYTQNHR